MASSGDEYRFVGSHAQEVLKGDKAVMVGPGDFIKLTADDMKDPHNKDLSDQGLFLKVGDK